MRTHQLIITLCFFAFTSYGQNFKQDMQKVYANYDQLENAHIVMQTRGYTEGSSKPVFDKETILYKRGMHFVYLMGTTEMLVNDNYSIWIDKEERRIICTPKIGEKKLTNAYGELPNLDSMLNQFNDAEYVGIQEGLKHYRIKRSGQKITQNDIYINPTTYLPAKVSYTYNPKVYSGGYRMEIVFEQMDLKPNFNANIFSEQKYIRVENDQWKLQPHYQSYELVITTDDF